MPKAQLARRPGGPTARQIAELEQSPRPYRNHYGGGVMHVGACSTPINAAVAAFTHLIKGDTHVAQVVAPSGDDAFRLHWTSAGIQTWVNPFARPKGAVPRPKLHRVK